jgi:hypothetical protein
VVRKKAIAEFWDRRDEHNTAQNFHGYSHEIPFSENQKIVAIGLLFEQLRQRKSMNFSPHVKRKNSAEVNALWWDCIRANCFRHYLGNSRCESLKAKLTLKKKDVPPQDKPGVKDPSPVFNTNGDITTNVRTGQPAPTPSPPKPPVIQGSLSLDACLNKTRVALACEDSIIRTRQQEMDCEPDADTGAIISVTENSLGGSLVVGTSQLEMILSLTYLAVSSLLLDLLFCLYRKF